MQGAGKGKRVMGGQPHGEGGEAGGGEAAAHPNAAPSGRIPVPRSAVRLPLEVATHLECRWRDDKYYPARIIERRKADSGVEDEYEYYVHYRKCACGSAAAAPALCWLAGLCVRGQGR